MEALVIVWCHMAHWSKRRLPACENIVVRAGCTFKRHRLDESTFIPVRTSTATAAISWKCSDNLNPRGVQCDLSVWMFRIRSHLEQLLHVMRTAAFGDAFLLIYSSVVLRIQPSQAYWLFSAITFLV
jgi:hypothetical protein